MWQILRQSINSVCTSWNKGVYRRILNLPHDAHTRLLGPLLKQNHINKQFIAMTLRFLLCLKSQNGIVKVCTLNALSNANSPMGSNLSLLRSKYGINFQSHSLAPYIKVATTVE